MKTRQLILGLLAFATIIIVAGAAYASCTGSNRISSRNAHCLQGWWDNNPWPKKSTFGVQVMDDCHLWGKVVAKIDLAACADKTWHLTHANKRTGSAACRVSDIHCCKDVGDLCRKRDLVTLDGCRSQFNDSPASDSCYLSGGTTYTAGSTSPSPVTTDPSRYKCSFWAKCEYITSEWTLEERQTSISNVHWLDADDLVNCGGVLKKNSC